ncbi:F-box only protein [Apis cerana cerana]|uniref:F-box only protein n=1 Tax=Apis cerana cerana TaxID=94128 RepID=A0A2A3EPW1_APICC|nr:F-box only protein [Apis cerana cerana]
MWDQLPELILTQIFSHLGHGDRANVAQAKYGQHIRSLELAWSRPYLLPREARITRNIQAEAGADFLTIVRAKNVQLRKLILTDWIFICKWGNRGKLLYALANFLGCQHNLETLSLLNATLGVSDVLRLLASASKSSTEHLAYLDLRGAFREWQAPHSNPRHVRHFYRLTNNHCNYRVEGFTTKTIFINIFINGLMTLYHHITVLVVYLIEITDHRFHCVIFNMRASFLITGIAILIVKIVLITSLAYLRLLGRFRALTILRLDYPALSDQTLIALTNAAPRVLKTLHISVRDSDSRHHTITDTAWHNLVLVCPELTVSYTIVNISHYEDMCYFLLPSVPLARFQMFSGHVWDQSRSRNFRSTVGLLITHYTNTLAEVMLQLRNNREMLDDLLVSMLVRCKHLTRLQYDGIIRSLDTLRDICQLQAENKTHFRTIHVKPRNVNARNRAILNDINYHYDHKMMEQGVDFRIEDPASVLVFY